MTQRTYLIGTLANLKRHGWEIRRAVAQDDFETIINDPKSATEAVALIEDVEMGYIVLNHRIYGEGILYILFQQGEAEEVIYDFSAEMPLALEMLSLHLGF